MRPLTTRLRLATRFAAVGLTTCTLFAYSATAAPTVVPGQGNTSVALSVPFIHAADNLQVTIGVIDPATVSGGTAVFPFLDGAIDAANAKGEILHGGGLSLKSSSTTVTLTDFIIDTTGSQPVLTGLVTAGGSVAGRLPLFNLALPALSLPLTPDHKGKLVIRDVGVTLTATAAAALNGAFHVSAFSEGVPIGTAKVKAKMLGPLE